MPPFCAPRVVCMLRCDIGLHFLDAHDVRASITDVVTNGIATRTHKETDETDPSLNCAVYLVQQFSTVAIQI